MTKITNSKQYDLEDRTLAYSKNARVFVKKLPERDEENLKLFQK